MSYQLKFGEPNSIPKGTVIFNEKDPVSCICVVAKGSVFAKNDYFKMQYATGMFFGVPDAVGHRYLMDYVTADDSVILAYEATDLNGVNAFLASNNKEYKGLAVSSVAKMYGEISKTHIKYTDLSQDLYELLKDAKDTYVKACKTGGVAVKELEIIENLKPYEEKIKIDGQDREYYVEMSNIGRNVMNAYYGDTSVMCTQAVKKTCDAFLKLYESTENVGLYVEDHYQAVYNNGENNLLCEIIKLSQELDKMGRADKTLEKYAKGIADQFTKIEEVVLQCMGNVGAVRKDRLKKVLSALVTGQQITKSEAEDTSVSDEDNYRALKNSLKTILAFGKMPIDFSKNFENEINQFVDSKDRLNTEDAGRKLRHKIADSFYKIYREVFINSMYVEKLPKPVDLFLDYGFVDERLVTKEQAVELCRLNVQTDREYFCNIFTIREWLREIYEGRREPSKNEFDLEYNDAVREKLKNKDITEEQAREMLKDQAAKLDYEIFNMFKYTERIVNGSLSTFVPVLCSEQIATTPMRSLITKDRIGQTVERFRELDFSAFYREQLFADKELGIEKEVVQVEVKPDIILFPCFGSNGSMWQEISCKVRTSSGRFLLPVMFEGNLDDIYLINLGRYRWELCRTMQGSAWNNIQFKSLTSEFMDYVQYYKKNKALTDDKKEKLKNQIMKAKNSEREVFVMDYVAWMKYESTGGMKLNKPSREILALYCPFDKETRKKVASQPAINESIERYNREAAKKTRELELRHHALVVKSRIEIPEIMQNTLKLYKEM